MALVTQDDIVDEMSMVQRIDNEIATLSQHIEVLRVISDTEPVGADEISQQTSLPTHNVRFSVRILEQEDLIKSSPEGLQTTDGTDDFVSDLMTDIDRMEEQVGRFPDIFGSENE